MSAGVGYYSQNIMSKTAQAETGKTGFLGEANYPFLFKYDSSIFSDWFLTSQFAYTLLPRSTPGDRAKVTLMHLMFQFGQNFDASNWSWNVGPGYLQQTIKGSGGSVELNNGSATAQFAIPGRDSQITQITVNVGTTWTLNPHQVALDLITENFFSNTKRAHSLMLSYTYIIGSSF